MAGSNHTQLKPCPFCGAKAKMHTEQVAEDCMEAWVICTDCGASSERIEGAYSERSAAAAAWNQRAADGTREVLQRIADMDPAGQRADDLGRAARMARDAITPV